MGEKLKRWMVYRIWEVSERAERELIPGSNQDQQERKKRRHKKKERMKEAGVASKKMKAARAKISERWENESSKSKRSEEKIARAIPRKMEQEAQAWETFT
ncbi:hypothetical protein Tco_0702499 [Tanacetum coccineum]|uniref:Uncharacterized protein n=1 Tax=Tanacetum coccineum TaxID=301880 RepID=A0ABQ4XW45_9ASTR